MKPDETIFIPLGAIHRIENPYKKPVKIIEAQVGSIFERNRYSEISRCLRKSKIIILQENSLFYLIDLNEFFYMSQNYLHQFEQVSNHFHQ